MARQPQPTAPATPVRWTDEEWQAIAAYIVANRGDANAAAIDVADIKAKDVFLAQDVLPEPRRRKLISIQQGFEVSRQRLRAQLDALPAPETKASAPGGRRGDRPPAGGKPRSQEKNLSEPDHPGEGTGAQPVAGAALEAVPESADHAGAAAPAEAARVQEQAPAGPPAESGSHRAPAPAGEAVAAPGAPSAASSAHALPPPVRPDKPEAERKKAEPRSEAASPTVPVSDFVEMARPFVAMVCEELARAFVKALGANANPDALRAAMGAKPPKAAAAPHERQRQREAFQPDAGGRAPAAAAEAPERAAPDPDDDLDQAETDVQPLFDPKLPPDANSPFRPRIALVASRADDLLDLQQRFPQFELFAVTLDELRSNPVLRSCQRIVGLREDVPVGADEYLRRTYGNRYFRANGGVAKVREQLQSWLNNPVVGSTDTFRPPRQSNGKGAGAKKRQFRRPRT